MERSRAMESIIIVINPNIMDSSIKIWGMGKELWSIPNKITNTLANGIPTLNQELGSFSIQMEAIMKGLSKMDKETEKVYSIIVEMVKKE